MDKAEARSQLMRLHVELAALGLYHLHLNHAGAPQGRIDGCLNASQRRKVIACIH
ncbi:hypothetical protein K9857_00280 [Pseudomonas sp. REP124]|uniref:hypothetical protein n=1 Tax=Pseudomonas sp. REP124 TaxID=2875731 RepID=UPI001CCAB8FA|nr:hypothetical protein [Pseudomonas sp. REP124]MBZ9779989.1 hypothetical protein [Pseudomonas sp. REP124]